MSNRSDSQSGIIVPELVITIVIASGLVIGFAGLYITAQKLGASANNSATASNFAYSILRKYVNAVPQSATNWFNCDTETGGLSAGQPKVSSTNDAKTNTNASGTFLDGTTAAGKNVPSSVTLPTPAKYTVKAIAPYGCTKQDWLMPVRLQVDVTYGSDARKVSHAAYATQY